MLFRVSGKFANKHTFSVNPVDGTDAKEALATVMNSADVKEFGSPVISITVKALSGSNKKVRISDKPAAERKPSTPRKTATPAKQASRR